MEALMLFTALSVIGVLMIIGVLIYDLHSSRKSGHREHQHR